MNIAIILKGGLVDRVLKSTNPVGFRVIVVDCDTEGADEDNLTLVELRLDGTEKKVYLSLPQFYEHAIVVDAIFKQFDKE